MTKDEVERTERLIATRCRVSRLKRHAACAENGGRPWCGLPDIPPERVDPDDDWSRVTCLLCWEAKRYPSNHPCLACWPIVVWVSSSGGYCEHCRSRPARWTAALAELRTLQAEYQNWRDQLPEPLADSRTAEFLDEVCDVDLDALDLKLLRSFGRD